jgi:hypothetical protein
VKNAKQTKHVPRVSDAAVEAKTGKTWQEWLALLDAAGAREMDHKSIAAYLHKQLGVPGWWAQGVAQVSLFRPAALVGVCPRRAGAESHPKRPGKGGSGVSPGLNVNFY